MDLISSKKVSAAILGTDTYISEFEKSSINIPTISLPVAAAYSLNPPLISPPSLIQMAHDMSYHTQCAAAIVGHFKWRKVTVIYENKNDMSTKNIETLILLSNSLRDFNAEIEQISAFSSSFTEAMIEEKLKGLAGRERTNYKVFIVMQFSMELAKILFHKANKMNMMDQNGYFWIVGDEISSLLDSLGMSNFHNMQGVIGFRTYFDHSKDSFKQFRRKFRRKYISEYHQEDEDEEENIAEPSIFGLRAYDASWALAQAMLKLQGNFSSKQLLKEILGTEFEGLSGKIGFDQKNGMLMQAPTFEIIYVVGKSYKEVAFWKQNVGFFNSLNEDHEEINNGVVDLSRLVYWGGRGHSRGLEEGRISSPDYGVGRTLRIGVPANNTFHEFVKVSYDHINGIYISGFSITVFEAVVKNLPYPLSYKLVPFNGSYDGLVNQVYTKVNLILNF